MDLSHILILKFKINFNIRSVRAVRMVAGLAVLVAASTLRTVAGVRIVGHSGPKVCSGC